MLQLLIGSTILSAERVTVSGDIVCPTSAQIGRYLEPLLPDARDAAHVDQAVVEMGSDSELLVILTTADGVVLKRAIPRSSACDHLAETVAVLIASWETQLHPGWFPTIEPALDLTATRPSSADDSVTVWTTLGALASEAAGSIAPGVWLGLAVGPRRRGWTARLLATGVAARGATLGPGEISWSRWSAGAGLGRKLGAGPFDVDMEAAVVGGAVIVTGRGFSSNETVMRPDVGLSVAARLQWRTRQVEPWIGVGLDIWPLEQEARVLGWPDGRPLPHFEPRIGIGISALVWP